MDGLIVTLVGLRCEWDWMVWPEYKLDPHILHEFMGFAAQVGQEFRSDFVVLI